MSLKCVYIKLSSFITGLFNISTFRSRNIGMSKSNSLCSFQAFYWYCLPSEYPLYYEDDDYPLSQQCSTHDSSEDYILASLGQDPSKNYQSSLCHISFRKRWGVLLKQVHFSIVCIASIQGLTTFKHLNVSQQHNLEGLVKKVRRY